MEKVTCLKFSDPSQLWKRNNNTLTLTNKEYSWQLSHQWDFIKYGEKIYIKNISSNMVLESKNDGSVVARNISNGGEFVKNNNNVKRQQEYANLILFQIKLKDGN